MQLQWKLTLDQGLGVKLSWKLRDQQPVLRRRWVRWQQADFQMRLLVVQKWADSQKVRRQPVRLDWVRFQKNKTNHRKKTNHQKKTKKKKKILQRKRKDSEFQLAVQPVPQV